MRTCAAPWPGGGIRGKTGTDRIHLHITGRCKKIWLIHRERGKSSLPKMTAPIFPEIYHATISPVRLPDPSAQSVFTFRHCDEMYMIWHKAVCPDFNTALLTPLRHEVDVRIVIIVSKKGCQTPIPTLSDMVRYAGSYNTSDTSHMQKLIE